MRKILPILLLMIGIGGGAAAGFMLKPSPELVEVNPCGDVDMAEGGAEPGDDEEGEPKDKEYVKLNNQFVVPVMADGRVASLVVMSLSVEVATGLRETVYAREPKLRDVFLQVLFDHANMGGFDGAFTNSNNMDILRNSLWEASRKVMDGITDILITDVARQDNN